MINQLFTTESGDKAAIGLSLACALHCLMVPLLLALFPSGALSSLGDERIHLGLQGNQGSCFGLARHKDRIAQ